MAAYAKRETYRSLVLQVQSPALVMKTQKECSQLSDQVVNPYLTQGIFNLIFKAEQYFFLNHIENPKILRLHEKRFAFFEGQVGNPRSVLPDPIPG